ncbi:MAG: DUF2800 domain-containing protein [Oscillospiraceae bacterium]
MSEHAVLSASAAERWLHCTAAPLIEAGMPDAGSSYAAEGTLAHSVAELKARKKFTIMGVRAYNAALKKLKADELWQAEMDVHTDTYLSRLTERAMCYAELPHVALEVRVDYSEYAENGFGTADCVMLGGDTLSVIDFKYGQSPNGRVSAENNSQMMLYALGALNNYKMFYGDTIKHVHLEIIQPRLDNISEWELSREELENWGNDTVKPAAAEAMSGEGKFCEGSWCHFCRAKAKCRLRAETNTALEDFKFAVSPTLSNTEIGEILIRAQRLKAWVSDLEDYALAACLKGEVVPGWKLVEGRSLRQFNDTETALSAIISAGTPKEMLYDYKPKTLAQIEKLMGVKPFCEVAGEYVIKPPGKPTLVPETDRREAYSGAAADFAGITNN